MDNGQKSTARMIPGQLKFSKHSASGLSFWFLLSQNERVKHIILYPSSFSSFCFSFFKKKSLPRGLPRPESTATFNHFWCLSFFFAAILPEHSWDWCSITDSSMICSLLYIIPQVLRQTVLCQDQTMFYIRLQFKIWLMLTLLMKAPQWTWNEWKLQALVTAK